MARRPRGCGLELARSPHRGIEALLRPVRREPPRLGHECVFGVLALDSEPGLTTADGHKTSLGPELYSPGPAVRHHRLPSRGKRDARADPRVPATDPGQIVASETNSAPSPTAVPSADRRLKAPRAAAEPPAERVHAYEPSPCAAPLPRGRFRAVGAIAAVLVALASTPASSQEPLLRCGLKPNPDAVGFRTPYRLDPTRQYDPEFTRAMSRSRIIRSRNGRRERSWHRRPRRLGWRRPARCTNFASTSINVSRSVAIDHFSTATVR
jgi:hypothetical protein